jgi:hypothetical protein
LHIADTLQTAAEFRLLPQHEQRSDAPSTWEISKKPRVAHLERSLADLIAQTWLPLTKGLNQINRSMGKADLYPFVLGQPVIAKLAFVADLVANAEAPRE